MQNNNTKFLIYAIRAMFLSSMIAGSVQGASREFLEKMEKQRERAEAGEGSVFTGGGERSTANTGSEFALVVPQGPVTFESMPAAFGADASAGSVPQLTNETCENQPVARNQQSDQSADNLEPAKPKSAQPKPQEQEQPSPGPLLDVRDEGVEIYKSIDSYEVTSLICHDSIGVCIMNNGNVLANFDNQYNQYITIKPYRLNVVLTLKTFAGRDKPENSWKVTLGKEAVLAIIDIMNKTEIGNVAFVRIDNLLFGIKKKGKATFSFEESPRDFAHDRFNPENTIEINNGFEIVRLNK